MLERARGLEVDSQYSAEEVRRHLTWLGDVMRRHGQVEFFVERIQPSWLPNSRARRQFQVACVLIIAIATGLIGLLVFSPLFALIMAIALGVAFATPREIRLIAKLPWSWRGLLGGAVIGLMCGLLLGYLVAGLIGALGIGSIGALVASLIGGLRSRVMDERDFTHPNEGMRRSLVNALLVGGLSCGILGGCWVAYRTGARKPLL
jgi:hypothetical protein